MPLIFWIFIFILSLVVLVKAADYFTDSAVELGAILRMPPFLVGVGLVAIGTSLPEIVTSILSVIEGNPEIVAGNCLGTVIANTLLGLGLAAIICKGIVRPKWNIFYGDFPILILSVILLLFTIRDGNINFGEALLFLGGFLIYLFYLWGMKKKNKAEDKKAKFRWKILIILILSLTAVYFSAKYIIFSIVAIAEITGFGTSVLAAVLIALGTSLPEISVALSAAKKQNWDLLVGDIIGSNIIDMFVIFGVSGLIAPLIFTQEIITIVIPFLLATLLMNWIILADKKITTTEGLVMVMLYVVFIIKMFGLF